MKKATEQLNIQQDVAEMATMEFISEMPTDKRDRVLSALRADSGIKEQMITVVSGLSVLTVYAKSIDARNDDRFAEVIPQLMPTIKADIVSEFACSVVDAIIDQPGEIVPDTTPHGLFAKRMAAVREYCL